MLLMACAEVSPYRLEPGELFPDGKPVGQSRSVRQQDIRMVRVQSVREADDFYRAMKVRYPDCCADYTHIVPENTYEVGIIRFWDSVVVTEGIREIHFVETVKPRRE